jgi:hypothetical protein
MHRAQRSAMVISRVPPSALSDLHPAVRMAGSARPLARLQERGVAGAAARGRRAAPHQSAAPFGLGRPRCARRPDPPPAANAADASAGRPRYRPAVALPPSRPEVDLPEQDRPAAGQRRDRSAHRAACHREPQLGLQADPRRTAQTGPPGRRVHDPPGPQGAEDTAGAEAAHRNNLAAVPACASRDDARHSPHHGPPATQAGRPIRP